MSLFSRKAVEDALLYTQRLVEELKEELEIADRRIEDLEGEVREMGYTLDNANVDDLSYDLERAVNNIGDLESAVDDLQAAVGESEKTASLAERVDSIDEVLQTLVNKSAALH